jgi:hypothetical protein
MPDVDVRTAPHAVRPNAVAVLAPWFHRKANELAVRARGQLRLTDRYRLDYRGTPGATLVCVVAGWKPELWPHVLPQIRAATRDCQVCLVTPGLTNESLREYCRVNKWSYLSTATADRSLAQNVCYRLHPDAELIVRIEEDVFVGPDTVSGLVDRLTTLSADGQLEPGLVAPLVPLEPFACRYALVQLGLLGAFESRFGHLTLSGIKGPLRNNTDAVRWIWQHTAPLSLTAKWFAANGEKTMCAPVRYGPGIAAFQRSFWREIGFFPVSRGSLMVGGDTIGNDDAHMCGEAVRRSRPIVIAADLLVGRFSFHHQYQELKLLLRTEPGWFAA